MIPYKGNMNFISTILQYSLNMPSKKIRFAEKRRNRNGNLCIGEEVEEKAEKQIKWKFNQISGK